MKVTGPGELLNSRLLTEVSHCRSKCHVPFSSTDKCNSLPQEGARRYVTTVSGHGQLLHLPACLSQDSSLWIGLLNLLIDWGHPKRNDCDCLTDPKVLSMQIQESIKGDCMLHLHSLLARMEDGFCFQQTLESRSFMLFHCQTGSASSWSVLEIVRLL